MKPWKLVWWVLVFTAILVMASPAIYGQGPVPPNDNIVPNGTGGYDVYPAGSGGLTHTHPQFGVSCTEDVHNVQWALDNADSDPGVVVLLKAGTFNFGDWQTNAAQGGTVMLHKQMTLKGDGFDANGDPRTKIHGGGHSPEQDQWQNESMAITWGGDGHDGVIEGIWLDEPHSMGISCNGFFGYTFTNLTIREVKVTNPSPEIPPYAVERDDDGNPIGASLAVAKAISIGGNWPTGEAGPLGKVVIENCTISNLYEATPVVENPFTGQPMPGDSYNAHGIGLWLSTRVSHEVRNNTLIWQGTGIVNEGLAYYIDDTEERFVGTTVIEGNDITIVNDTWPGRGVGYRCDSPRPFLIARNTVRVLSGGDGLVLANDCQNWGPHIEGDPYAVTQNDVEVQSGAAGSAALKLGYVRGPCILVDAEIKANKLRGDPQYGVVTEVSGMVNASARNLFLGNNLAHLDVPPEGAHYYFGPDTHDNVVRGYSGVVIDEGTNNVITGDSGAEGPPETLPVTGGVRPLSGL